MADEEKHSQAVSDLRGVLVRFQPGQQTYDAIVGTREEVFAQYRPIFSPEHISRLTKMAEYLTDLPPKELLERKLHQAIQRARQQIETQGDVEDGGM